MTDSNRTRLAYVTEVTEGTTPASPTMTKVRFTGESINYTVDSINSEEIRDDRLITDVIQVAARVNGGFNMELSYGAFDDFIESAMLSTWVTTPVLYNNGVADSAITDAGTVANTYAVASGGASFKTGHLVRASGFTNSANNQLFRVTSSTATTVVGTSLSLSAETAPPGTARLKVVGFRGASGDITATSTGLGSTSLDFTTLGLAVGQWVKIGGSTAGEQFATAALNDWARIIAISATALTLDNRPAGWTTDSGTGKTITVYISDYIKTGTTKKSFSIEKAFLGQTTPTYELFRGMLVGQFNLTFTSGQIVGGGFEFLGRTAAVGTSATGSAYSESASNDVFNAVSNVARLAEGGSTVAAPNYIRSLSLTLNNSLREQTAVGTMGSVGVGVGRSEVSGSLMTYFGDKTTYDKFLNDTRTSLNFRLVKNSKAMVFTMPKVKLTGGRTVASRGNEDVMAEFEYQALRDETYTSTNFQIDRFEEYA